MCTLIVLDRIVPGLPLLVALNRDEFLSRRAVPPARGESLEEGDPPIVAPRDLQAGGTWMGLNATGLFVGLTNRRGTVEQGDRRSRGSLVREALRQTSAKAVAEELRTGLEGLYNPFHLFYGDTRESFLTCLREEGLRTDPLSPGIHVICNRDPEDPSSSKIERIRGAVGQIDLERPVSGILEGLREILSDHGQGQEPLEQVCVHTPSYGTRSSTILALGVDRWRYWHAEGPPCQASYDDYTHLVDEIRP